MALFFLSFLFFGQSTQTGAASSLSTDPIGAAPLQGAEGTDLSSFEFLSEQQLKESVRISDSAEYNESANLLEQWIRGSLSAKLKENINTSCSQTLQLADPFFPMSDFNLRCVAWWLENRSLRREDATSKSTSATPSRQGRIFPSTPQDWRNVGPIGYRELINRFRPNSESSAIKAIDSALDANLDCTYAPTLAGLLNRSEEFLPSKAVWTRMQDVYEKYHGCTSQSTTDLGIESAHLRMGLTSLFFNDIDRAKLALEAALRVEEQEERQRSLFWHGLILHSQQVSREIISNFQNPSWQELVDTSPLAIHAVIARHVSGEDPYELVIQNVPQPVRRRDGLNWTDFNLVALTFELLAARGHATALKKWSERVDRDWRETQNDRRLFLAVAHSKARNYLGAIKLLSSYLRSHESQSVQLGFMQMLFPTPYQEKILKYSDGVDPLVVYSLIRQESAFNPFARSIANARGLMQLMPATARSLAQRIRTKELYDPSKNIKLGSKYLKRLMTRHDYQLEHVLAAYNAGTRNLQRWLRRFPGANNLLFADLIPFRETRNYVALIQRNSYWYGRLWMDESATPDAQLAAVLQNSNHRSQVVNTLLQQSVSPVSGSISPEPLSLLPDIHDFRHFADNSDQLLQK